VTPALGLTFVALTTAYCQGEITAEGLPPIPRWTVAADRSLPIGTLVHVEGLGSRRVEDRGSAIKGHRLDIYMPDCRAARRWGVQQRSVAILALPGPRNQQVREVASLPLAEPSLGGGKRTSPDGARPNEAPVEPGSVVRVTVIVLGVVLFGMVYLLCLMLAEQIAKWIER
jgi:3D (Asp-Asp-Asp) domain-containing protein